ncbi:hypothetical protein PM082_024398 [Marasmius tenuissimus]|nr:hypothetical protein PM082_024398 [Marasmius tenuissimus]
MDVSQWSSYSKLCSCHIQTRSLPVIYSDVELNAVGENGTVMFTGRRASAQLKPSNFSLCADRLGASVQAISAIPVA